MSKQQECEQKAFFVAFPFFLGAAKVQNWVVMPHSPLWDYTVHSVKGTGLSLVAPKCVWCHSVLPQVFVIFGTQCNFLPHSTVCQSVLVFQFLQSES